MYLLFASMLVVLSNASMLAEQIANSHFEIGFDINRFEDGNLRGHPDITRAPPPHYDGGWFHSRDCTAVRYFPPSIYERRHQLEISCSGSGSLSPYHALRWVGFTHEQILGARHISVHADHDIYELKTATRTFDVSLSRFEKFLGYRRGYDFVHLKWR